MTASASGYVSETKAATVNDGQTTIVDFALQDDISPTVSVASFTYTTEGGQNGDKHLNVKVALEDNQGNPVAGASVSVTVDNIGNYQESYPNPLT